MGRIRAERMRRRFGSCGERVGIDTGLVSDHPELLSIGNDVSIGTDVGIMGAGGVVIRTGAMLATRTLILTTQHDPKAEIMRDGAVHSGVDIGEFAWIGASAILLPGARVGHHAIVGAGAVVTREIPPYALAVGVPARVVRDRRRSEAEGS